MFYGPVFDPAAELKNAVGAGSDDHLRCLCIPSSVEGFDPPLKKGARDVSVHESNSTAEAAATSVGRLDKPEAKGLQKSSGLVFQSEVVDRMARVMVNDIARALLRPASVAVNDSSQRKAEISAALSMPSPVSLMYSSLMK